MKPANSKRRVSPVTNWAERMDKDGRLVKLSKLLLGDVPFRNSLSNARRGNTYSTRVIRASMNFNIITSELTLTFKKTGLGSLLCGIFFGAGWSFLHWRIAHWGALKGVSPLENIPPQRMWDLDYLRLEGPAGWNSYTKLSDWDCVEAKVKGIGFPQQSLQHPWAWNACCAQCPSIASKAWKKDHYAGRSSKTLWYSYHTV